MNKISSARGHLIQHTYIYLTLAGLSLGAAVAGFLNGSSAQSALPPIQHVVIIYQENHTFDNVLGKFCVQTARCNGATTGKISTGETIPLSPATDLVPRVAHDVYSHQLAIDGGLMDKFDLIDFCAKDLNNVYPCYTQYDSAQIPNLASLAQTYTISDATFEFTRTPSWAGHMVLASATMDNFQGDNPLTSRSGWGCDSNQDVLWWDGSNYIQVPSCVPDINGKGPYRASPVAYVPTIFDRLDQAAKSWKIYGGTGKFGNKNTGYLWSICPTFYECLGSAQRQKLVAANSIIKDAAKGKLPSFSVVTPNWLNSQHNGVSMATGDNWIGQVVSAVQHDVKDWPSTAIFITYDDCGCFYDHVAPPTSTHGIRVPMVIVSPYAKLGYTDSATADFISMLSFTEHLFNLPPLNSNDATAYDFANSFNTTSSFSRAKVLKPTQTKIPAAEQKIIDNNPGDPNDPT